MEYFDDSILVERRISLLESKIDQRQKSIEAMRKKMDQYLQEIEEKKEQNKIIVEKRNALLSQLNLYRKALQLSSKNPKSLSEQTVELFKKQSDKISDIDEQILKSEEILQKVRKRAPPIRELLAELELQIPEFKSNLINENKEFLSNFYDQMNKKLLLKLRNKHFMEDQIQEKLNEKNKLQREVNALIPKVTMRFENPAKSQVKRAPSAEFQNSKSFDSVFFDKMYKQVSSHLNQYQASIDIVPTKARNISIPSEPNSSRSNNSSKRSVPSSPHSRNSIGGAQLSPRSNNSPIVQDNSQLSPLMSNAPAKRSDAEPQVQARTPTAVARRNVSHRRNGNFRNSISGYSRESSIGANRNTVNLSSPLNGRSSAKLDSFPLNPSTATTAVTANPTARPRRGNRRQHIKTVSLTPLQLSSIQQPQQQQRDIKVSSAMIANAHIKSKLEMMTEAVTKLNALVLRVNNANDSMSGFKESMMKKIEDAKMNTKFDPKSLPAVSEALNKLNQTKHKIASDKEEVAALRMDIPEQWNGSPQGLLKWQKQLLEQKEKLESSLGQQIIKQENQLKNLKVMTRKRVYSLKKLKGDQ